MDNLRRTGPKKDVPRCTAITKHGENAGSRCKNAPILGGTVCHKHGGGAKQVREKANQRLLEMVMPALAKLKKIVNSPHTSDADAIHAIREVLNRTGFTERFALTIAPEDDKWEQIVGDVLVDVDYSGLREEDELPPRELERRALEQLKYARSKLKEDAEAEARREWADLEEDDEDRLRRHVGLTRVVVDDDDGKSGTRIVNASAPNPNGSGPIDDGSLLGGPEPDPGPSEYDPRPDRPAPRWLRERLDLPPE